MLKMYAMSTLFIMMGAVIFLSWLLHVVVGVFTYCLGGAKRKY